MKCSFCKEKEAIIHIREYTDRGLNKINLCLDCALEKGFNATVDDINKLFKNLIKNIFNIKNIDNINFAKSLNKKDISLSCPICKNSYNNVVSDFKAGCPTCYSVFEQLIDLIIFKNNNSLSYRGRLPLYLNEVNNNRLLLEQLKKELQKNIKTENFVNAAIIRDKIKEVKKKIEKGVRRIAKN
ncbi:MAG: UvrB/UvrC motif-containing protein [Spirochaetes bacterium]|nr:UvrB/UvrC motif-containing protein [Spirochaetota bacterium]